MEESITPDFELTFDGIEICVKTFGFVRGDFHHWFYDKVGEKKE